MPSLRDALEAAIVENPDDLAAHMAYADHLHDQGDPRGELIQVQLALEKEPLAPPERARLKKREEELLPLTREACLGKKLAKALRPNRRDDVPEYTIRRGWLDAVEMLDGVMPEDVPNALAVAPEARLLRRYAVGWLECPWHGKYDADGTPVLFRSKMLANLRELRLGNVEGFLPVSNEPLGYNRRDELFHADGPFWGWVATMPRLEELTLEAMTADVERLYKQPLPHLRVLQLHLSDEYPLAVLAKNKTLTSLTHLSLHPCASHEEPLLGLEGLTALARSKQLTALTHLRYQKSDAGDEGVRVLIQSGLAERLKYLDLAMGTITDEGARLLAAADLGNLEVLDLSKNAIGRAGVRMLQTVPRTGLTVRLDDQGDQDEPGYWLADGEME